METVTTKCVNGILKAGDVVISTPDDEYACLVGRVTRINLLGTPEHDEETSNETDDVHVDFSQFAYSHMRELEIAEMFSALYGEKRGFDDCPLDDVIMPPNHLILICGKDKSLLDNLFDTGYNAACFCYRKLSEVVKTHES